MICYGRVAALSFGAWLTACSSGRIESQSAEYITGSSPPPYAPPMGTVILVAPDGLGAQGAPCARGAECSSGVCWRGFCGESAPVTDGGGPGITGEACAQDAYCQSGFCDLGVCTELFGPLHYGFECTPDPPHAPPGRCGAYLCVNGRCRSCESDAQCRSLMGAPTCAFFEEDRPGKLCGKIAAGLSPATPAEPPPMTPVSPRP
jgi:hypothetical protein